MESRFPLGKPLKEAQLAEELGISRTPVREALRRLELEGLLVNAASGRYTLRLPSSKEITEASAVLRALDTLLFSLAAEKATEHQRERLVTIARSMVQAAEAGDDVAWEFQDREFHDLIRIAADNAQASEIVQQVRRRIQRFSLRPDVSKRRFVPCSMEHLDLAHSILKRDLAGIAEGVAHHIDMMENSVIQTIESLTLYLGGDEPEY